MSNPMTEAEADKGVQIDVEVVQNVPVTISVEVGRAVLKIRDHSPDPGKCGRA